MKRKFLSAVVITGALFLTACQEDETMDELIQETEKNSFDVTNISEISTTSGSGGASSDRPGGN